MATDFSGRYSKPLGANRHAAGGLLEGAPIEALASRAASYVFLDFIDKGDYVVNGTPDGGDNWTMTEVGTSGDVTLGGAETNGALIITSTTDNEGPGSLQLGATIASRPLVPAAGSICMFEARVKHSAWASGDWFIGVGEYDITFLSAGGAITASGGDNHAGFHHEVADAATVDLSACGVALANIQTITGTGVAAGALMANRYYRFGVRIDGVSRVRFYIDDQPVSPWTTLTANLAEPLVPTFAMIADGTLRAMYIDYVLAVQTRA